MKSEKQLSTFGKQKSTKVLQIFAFQKIASVIDAEAPKGSSAPITDAIGPDCWTHYIGEGIIIKKILDINQIQKSDNKLESTKLFLNKKLSEIFSVDISSKYTSFLPDHNKILISRLLNEEDIEKREKFQKIFNLTFADCIQLFLGNNNKYIEFEGFPVLDEIKDELNEDNEYLEKIKNFLLNFEDIIKHKKPRKRNKKESSEININKDNLNQA